MKEPTNTLIYLVIGDNGASAEGSINGTINELGLMNATDEAMKLEGSVLTPEFLIEQIDEFGTLASYNH